MSSELLETVLNVVGWGLVAVVLVCIVVNFWGEHFRGKGR